MIFYPPISNGDQVAMGTEALAVRHCIRPALGSFHHKVAGTSIGDLPLV